MPNVSGTFPDGHDIEIGCIDIIEQVKLDAGGLLRVQRKVYPRAIPCCALGVRFSGQYASRHVTVRKRLQTFFHVGFTTVEKVCGSTETPGDSRGGQRGRPEHDLIAFVRQLESLDANYAI